MYSGRVDLQKNEVYFTSGVELPDFDNTYKVYLHNYYCIIVALFRTHVATCAVTLSLYHRVVGVEVAIRASMRRHDSLEC